MALDWSCSKALVLFPALCWQHDTLQALSTFVFEKKKNYSGHSPTKNTDMASRVKLAKR